MIVVALVAYLLPQHRPVTNSDAVGAVFAFIDEHAERLGKLYPDPTAKIRTLRYVSLEIPSAGSEGSVWKVGVSGSRIGMRDYYVDDQRRPFMRPKVRLENPRRP